MAVKYKEGDVVDCRFPLQEDPIQFTLRPGLILRVDYVGTTPYFITAKITSSDNSNYITGKWILADSKTGQKMRLSNNSFIHLENIARLPLTAIRRLRGSCNCLQELKEMCSENGITY